MKSSVIRTITIVLAVFTILSCANNSSNSISNINQFSEYINGYTSGTISSGESIKISLCNETSEIKGTELQKGIITFNPKIEGKAYWISSHEIEFIPSERLQNGKDYTCVFNLSKIIKVSYTHKTFIFPFSVLKQSISISQEPIKQQIDGSAIQCAVKLLSADYLSKEKVENILTIDGNYNTRWTHSLNGCSHTLIIDSITKLDKQRIINVEWDGAAYGINEQGKSKIIIPAKDEFYIIDILPEVSNNKQFKIIFSDAIDDNQDLRGLIQLEGYKNLKFNISSNELTVYAENDLSQERSLYISKGIKSIRGKHMLESQTKKIMFEEIKPAVKFIGKGVITPSPKGFIIPFSAVGLKSVELRIIKIYNNNIHQFLQDNNFDNSNNIKRVGKLILKKKINLQENNINLGKWNDFRLNLEDLIEVDKSSIYRIELRFKKQDALVSNDEDNKEESTEQEDWDNPGWYSDYYYPENYDWRDRDDPRTVSYYTSSRYASKNVFASNIGVIAKQGSNNNMIVYVSELTTTDAIKGAEVTAYSYQNQVLASSNTNSYGFAELKLNSKPFLIVVANGKEKAYLRVDDGSSLSISNFDVTGEVVQKGLKGFIYGDRGVWRPGDNIHISFILEDKEKTLPTNHPIVAVLYNSKGQQVKKIVQNITDTGINCFTFFTQEEAPTGNWRVEIQVGGAVFSKSIKVETIKPNRLKINMTIDGGIIKLNNTPSLKISTSWLHGAKAPNLKTDVKMSLYKAKTLFEGYSNYIFDDKSKSFWFDEKTIFEGVTNEGGELKVNIPIHSLSNAPGMLRASFVTRVFEKTGDFSISGKSFKLSPFKSYVGMQIQSSDNDWYKTNTAYKLNIVSLKDSGIKINNNLTVELYKVGWRWWWDSDNNDLASYVNRNYNKNVTIQNITTINGKAQINISAKEDGRYYLKITDNISGHSCGQTLYFSEWGGFNIADVPGGASMLALSLSKSSYKVGEQITVNIPSSNVGRALVSIESGTKVVDKFIIVTKDKKTQFSFKATAEMSPNVYINVSLIQEYQNTDNDHPMRLYGVIPVKIEDTKTVLTPIIKQSNELRPEKEFTIEVSEKEGKQMSYTIAIVDEGLLDITSFNTPNPHSSFYAREALGVKTWDMYDYVIGAYGARLENAFAIGGDEEIKANNKKNTNRFKPVVLFRGPFKLEKGKSQKHTFKMPNYIGAIRTMVVAADKGAYGSVSKRSEVKKPLMILASLPRMLNPGDKITLPVTLFVMNNKIKDVKLSLKLNDKIQNLGNSSQTIHFNEVGEKIAEFEIIVKNKIGKGKIEIIAESNGEKATHITDIDIRMPNPPITEVSEKFIEKGLSSNIDIKSIGIFGTNTAMLELSRMPAMNLSKHMEYLLGYPHGCLEQTVSGGFSQLYLSKLTNLTEVQKKQNQDNINICISKLMRFQTIDGGFTYWPGDDYILEWANLYAGNFIIMAEKEGYAIPAAMKKKWLRFQNSMANSWNEYSKYYNSELIQAYRLYILALAGEENIGAMNRMREKENIPNISKWRLAAAYAVAGRISVSEKIIDDLPVRAENYKEWGNTFGSNLRDKAMILETLLLLDKPKESYKLAVEISKSLGSGDWMSTQTISYSLYSMSRYFEKYNKKSSSFKCQYIINGNKQIVDIHEPIFSKQIDINKLEKANISIKNLGEEPMFLRVINTGVPLKYVQEQTTNKLKMNIVYRDVDGKVINPEIINQGTDIVAEVSVSNNSYSDNYEQLALVWMFPTGWEISNSRLFDGKEINSADFLDIRDDRVNIYFSLNNKRSKIFKFNLNASYKGEYYMPAVSCAAMYDNEIRATIAGKKVIVK